MPSLIINKLVIILIFIMIMIGAVTGTIDLIVLIVLSLLIFGVFLFPKSWEEAIFNKLDNFFLKIENKKKEKR